MHETPPARMSKATLVAALALTAACVTQRVDAAPVETGEWTIRCLEARTPAGAPGETCEMLTEITLEGSGRTIAQLALYRAPDNEVVIEQRLPTGAHIPSGVLSAIDRDMTFRPTLIACNATWCIARSRATPEAVAAMKRGFVLASILVDPTTLKQVTVPFSLIGFSATLKQWALRIGL